MCVRMQREREMGETVFSRATNPILLSLAPLKHVHLSTKKGRISGAARRYEYNHIPILLVKTTNVTDLRNILYYVHLLFF